MAVKKEIYPVLPLRDIVVYPKMIVPLFVGREKSINALQRAVDNNDTIVLVTQKDAAIDNPQPENLYTVGTLSTILQLVKLPDGTFKVLIEGMQRVKLAKFDETEGFIKAEAMVMPETDKGSFETEATARAVISQFEEYVKLSKKTPPEVLVSVNQIEDFSKLADTIASHLSLKVADKQELLEAKNLQERFEKVLKFMNAELTLL